MISNHYAMTYGARHNWLVLIAMSFAGACIRAWFVARHKPAARGSLQAALPAVLGAMTLAAVVVALSPPRDAGFVLGAGPPPTVDAAEVQGIVERRCAPCHAASPRQPGFNAAPNGLVFQTTDQLRAHWPEVRQQLAMRAMPLGNLTGMTDAERETLLMWIGHGGAR
jgi:uncharacterized membrane protein